MRARSLTSLDPNREQQTLQSPGVLGRFDGMRLLPYVRPAAAHEAVRRIDALYLIERQIKDLEAEERTRIRREEAVPQLESLHEWAAKMQHETMPSAKLGKAL